ncbi:MAG: transposase, partial [Verrucomicrobiota bacterium]
CYATGRFGSRTIEAATFSDVAVRYLCANLHPDHSSICEFRMINGPAFRVAFVSVLQLAQELHLSKVGAVSVDGTKIQANASKHAAVSYQRAGEMIEQLELEVKELMGRAEQADAKEAEETLDIPAELARREKRVGALKQARQVIEERAKEMAVATVEKHSHHKTVADLLPQPEPAAPGPEASAKEVMAHRLKSEPGKTLYKLRKQTVEPVFGIIKEVMGFRRFLLRGRVKAGLEWTLVCVSYNLKRMFALKNLAAAG